MNHQTMVKNQSRELCISAQEMSERFKIPYSKINYYTYLGFFEIIKKEGNKRFYDISQVETRYKAVSEMINEGYPLALIRKKLVRENGHELL